MFKKVLYDEREWRSVQDASWLNVDYGIEKYDEAIELGYLPEKYNLKFNDDDVSQIIVNEDLEIERLLDIAKKNSFLIGNNKLKKILTTRSKLLNG